MNAPAYARPARRRLVVMAATLLLASLALVGPLAQKAFGATYTASDQASWVTAVADALANSGEPNTITLTADFSVGCATLPCVGASFSGGASNLTIEGGGHTITNTGTYREGFLYAASGSADVTLHNITLDGYNNAAGMDLTTTGTVTLDHVTVTNSGSDDAALRINAQNVLITDSTFTDNSDFGVPGAALYLGCINSATVRNSTFTHNTATSSNGGALYAACPLQVYDSTFTNNHADGNGGAIYGDRSLDVHSSTFTTNTAGGNGGALHSAGADTIGYDSTFTGNHADGDGGAEWGYGWADSYNSTWDGNTAGGNGGAIYSVGATNHAYAAESTFVDNTAGGVGGAVYVEAQRYWTYSSDFIGNSDVGEDAAHIYVADSYLTSFASVFGVAIGPNYGCWSLTEPTSLGYNFDASLDGSCSDFAHGTGDTWSAGADAALGSLADNGGPTETLLPQPGSPLIDAIPWGDCSAGVFDDYDQRYVDRQLAGADTAGCDIGAVEVAPSSVSFVVSGATGDINVTLDNAYCYQNVDSGPASGLPGTPPAGVSFPFGAFTFDACTFPGDTVTVHVTLPSPANVAYKVDGSTWSAIPGVTFSGTTFAYSITDDGPLDQYNDVANSDTGGHITDPVAPGIGASFTG